MKFLRSLPVGALFLAAACAPAALVRRAVVADAGFSPAAERTVASAVLHVGMTVSDLDRSIAFYCDVLAGIDEIAGDDVERVAGVFGLRARVARLVLGTEALELTEYLAPRGRSIPEDSRSNDRWFQHVAIVVSDMDRAYARLREHRVEHASSGPQTLPLTNPNAGGIRAFYFKDPDHHVLEVIWFPEGKGDPRWQAPTERLFLGIDHTAIVVADTRASLAFYHDALGLAVAGTSENHGTEQEHLNNVFGARLAITTLRARSGPGVELLEYLSPRDGRPYPADARANDRVHWHTAIAVDGLDRAAARLHARGEARFVSPGVVPAERALPRFDGVPGAASVLTLTDPDGHVVRLQEPQPRSQEP
jgi:catechol 2,3-dioxygenase-like lactoylglutathione lyase family enzyme